MGKKFDVGSGLLDELTKGLTDMSDSLSSAMRKQFVRGSCYRPGDGKLNVNDLDLWVNLNHVEAFDVSYEVICKLQMPDCYCYCFKEDLKNTSFSFVVEEDD